MLEDLNEIYYSPDTQIIKGRSDDTLYSKGKIVYTLRLDKQLFRDDTPYHYRQIGCEDLELDIEPYIISVKNTLFQFECFYPDNVTADSKNKNLPPTELTMRLWLSGDFDIEKELYKQTYKHTIEPFERYKISYDVALADNKEIILNWNIRNIYLSIEVLPAFVHVKPVENLNNNFIIYIVHQ